VSNHFEIDVNQNLVSLFVILFVGLIPRRDAATEYTLAVMDLQEEVDIELSKLLDGLDSLPEGL
jgi:hypothetical protein